MAEVGSARLTSLERVTTGVGSVSRDARAKPNSLGRSLRLPLPDGAVSMTFCPKLLITDKMPEHQQCQQLERVSDALGAEEFPRRDKFSDSNERRT